METVKYKIKSEFQNFPKIPQVSKACNAKSVETLTKNQLPKLKTINFSTSLLLPKFEWSSNLERKVEMKNIKSQCLITILWNLNFGAQ